MPKFANRPVAQHGAITSNASTPNTRTYEGGAGFTRDAKSELFLLAVANMCGEDTFYEAGGERDKRFTDLVHECVRTDPDWVARFIPYLRDTMQMRSASVAMACEYVAAHGPHGAAVIDSACSRADEPGEVLAYWFSAYGRKSHAAINRGVARAAVRLYNEHSLLRYDGNNRAWRFGDVIDLVHPKPRDDRQSALFRFAIDRRHNRSEIVMGSNGDGTAVLNTLWNDSLLSGVDQNVRRDFIRRAMSNDPAYGAERRIWQAAGWSWERLAGWLPGGMDAEAWEAVIPNMGYMASIRNLRNFDQAGISDAAVAAVVARLTDPDEVVKSRQFPLRFLSAWNAVEGMRWGYTLETALNHSLAAVPSLGGRSLILVDVSGSMTYGMGRSTVAPWQTASIFGSALAIRAANADLFAYSTSATEIRASKGASVLRVLETINKGQSFGGGTDTVGLLARIWSERGPYDRVIVLTDEQAFDAHRGLHAVVDSIPLIYTWNLNGYRAGHQPSGTKGRFSFGGLTDAGFRAIELLERGRDAAWDF